MTTLLNPAGEYRSYAVIWGAGIRKGLFVVPTVRSILDSVELE